MDEVLASAQVKHFLSEFAEIVLRNKAELNTMDSACGDGDFGTSMFIAFKRVRDMLDTVPTLDISTLFAITGETILSSAGGSASPLFGTLFSEVGKKIAKGKVELSVTDLAQAFESAERKIEFRGGAKVGDKTLLDSFDPAVASLISSSANKTALGTALDEAAQAAKKGYENTAQQVAKHGRARYLGEQTLGHPDPGAYVIALMFETLRVSTKDCI
jgi:dihydroxyacetone kinase-like protein